MYADEHEQRIQRRQLYARYPLSEPLYAHSTPSTHNAFSVYAHYAQSIRRITVHATPACEFRPPAARLGCHVRQNPALHKKRMTIILESLLHTHLSQETAQYNISIIPPTVVQKICWQPKCLFQADIMPLVMVPTNMLTGRMLHALGGVVLHLRHRNPYKNHSDI